MNDLEIKAKQYTDTFYSHEFETEEVSFKKADIRIIFKKALWKQSNGII